MENGLALIARALLAATFLASAVDKTLHPEAAKREIRTLEGHTQIPLPANVMLALVLIAQWGGGLAMFHTATAPYGAAILLAFLTPVTFVAHQFWAVPREMRKQKIDHFLANAAIAGGLLLVAVGGLT